jgi:hypothetical protein
MQSAWVRAHGCGRDPWWTANEIVSNSYGEMFTERAAAARNLEHPKCPGAEYLKTEFLFSGNPLIRPCGGSERTHYSEVIGSQPFVVRIADDPLSV